MAVPQPVCFFRRKVQDLHAICRQGHFNGDSESFSALNSRLNFRADSTYRVSVPKRQFCKRGVLAQQSKQQVLRLDKRAAVLARLIARKENYPPSLLRIALKHEGCSRR